MHSLTARRLWHEVDGLGLGPEVLAAAVDPHVHALDLLVLLQPHVPGREKGEGKGTLNTGCLEGEGGHGRDQGSVTSLVGLVTLGGLADPLLPIEDRLVGGAIKRICHLEAVCGGLFPEGEKEGRGGVESGKKEKNERGHIIRRRAGKAIRAFYFIKLAPPVVKLTPIWSNLL